jgi:hypothetical protein
MSTVANAVRHAHHLSICGVFRLYLKLSVEADISRLFPYSVHRWSW